MKRIFNKISLAFIFGFLSFGVNFYGLNNVVVAQTSPEVVAPAPKPLESQVLITGYKTSSGGVDFVQIYNTSSDIVNLNGWSLKYLAANQNEEAEFSVDLSGYILPKSFAVFGVESSAGNLDGVIQKNIFDGNVVWLKIVGSDGSEYQTRGNVFRDGVRFDMIPTSAGSYTSSRNFTETPVGNDILGGGLYIPESSAGVQIVEISANPKDCSVNEIEPTCYDYVKIYNPTSDVLSLDQLRLRLGYANDSVGITNSVDLSGVINPGEFKSISYRNDGAGLQIPSSGGVWLEDKYGLAVFNETLVEYADLSGVKNKGQSWALIDNSWTWGEPNYNLPNIAYQPKVEEVVSEEPMPCKEGQYRNEETGRCRNIEVESAPTPCKEGQYRSEETGRCRNVESSQSTLTPCRADQYRSDETGRCRNISSSSSTTTLTPCKAGQYRNEETNRCRNITTASSTSTLTPCKEGQERNPETNRCRNIKSTVAPAADFKIENIEDSGDNISNFPAWKVALVLFLIGLVLAIWSYRQSLINFLRKIFRRGEK